MNFTRQELVSQAAHIGSLPDHLNPIKNPSAGRHMSKDARTKVGMIARDGELRRLAMGHGGHVSMPGPGLPPPNKHHERWGQQVQPSQVERKRYPQVRHNVVGCAATAAVTTGPVQVKWSPKTPFKPSRLFIPTFVISTADGTISDMRVGVQGQTASLTSEPWETFNEKSLGGSWDLDQAVPGVDITATLNTGTNVTFYGAWLGEVQGKPYPINDNARFRRLPMGSTSIAAGASATITLTPAIGFRPRRVVLDDLSVGSCIITGLFVGVEPQLMSSDPVPAAIFSDLSQEIWVDFDKASLAQPITFLVTNLGGSTTSFGGAMLGDVDPKELVQYQQPQYA